MTAYPRETCLLLKVVGEVEIDGVGDRSLTFKKAVDLEPGTYLVHHVWEKERGSKVTQTVRIYGLIADVEGIERTRLVDS